MQSAEATAEPVEGTQSCPGGVRDNRLSGGRTVRNFVRSADSARFQILQSHGPSPVAVFTFYL